MSEIKKSRSKELISYFDYPQIHEIKNVLHRAGNLYPPVILASPVLQGAKVKHSISREGPAAVCIALQTPSLPVKEEFAALTMASI